MTFSEVVPQQSNITQVFYTPNLTRFNLRKRDKTHKNAAITPPPYETSSVSVAAVNQKDKNSLQNNKRRKLEKEIITNYGMAGDRPQKQKKVIFRSPIAKNMIDDKNVTKPSSLTKVLAIDRGQNKNSRKNAPNDKMKPVQKSTENQTFANLYRKISNDIVNKIPSCDPHCDVTKCPRKLRMKDGVFEKDKKKNKRKRFKSTTRDVSDFNETLKFEIKPKPKKNILKRLRNNKYKKLNSKRSVNEIKQVAKTEALDGKTTSNKHKTIGEQTKNNTFYEESTIKYKNRKNKAPSEIRNSNLYMERDSPKGNKVLCDDTNCEQSMSSSTTLDKIKEKLYSLHRKYSKLKQRNLDKRKEEISKLKNQQFVFSNHPKFNAETKKENACENKECFNTLPEKKNSKKTIKIRKNDSLLSTGLKRICCIFQQSDTGKSKKIKPGEKATYSTRRHENDQTGEPVLEIKVNTVGMCVMNPEDVKNKVSSYGKLANPNICVCPSHKSKKRNYKLKASCSSGLCKKAIKSKRTNFNCKCNPDKTSLCTDLTCKRNFNCVSDSAKQNDLPLFDLELDSDRMCILNSAELQNKIGDINNDKKLDPCNSGICRSSANANQNYICKCTQRQIIPEVEHCSEETCKSLDTKTGIFKSNAQSIKSKINTVKSNSENKNLHGLSKIKLKMSCICSQITSKPSLRHQKRKRENPGFYFKREKRNKLAIHNSNQDLQNQCYCRDKRCKRNSNGIYRCNLSEKGLLNDIIFQNENRRQHNFHRRKVIRIPSLIANRNETLYNCCVCAKNTPHCEKDISTNSRFRNYLSCSSVKNGVNFNESDNLSMKNNYSNDEIKQCPCELESSSRMAICKRFLCHSLSNFRIKRQQKRRCIKNCITNKNIKEVRLKTGIEQNPYGPKEYGDINKDHQCLCHHICECGMIKVRSKKNKGRIIKRSSKLKSKQKKKLKGRKNKQDNKSARKRRKEFLKEEKTFQKETKKKEKAERKKREKSFLLEKKQLEAINKGKEELDETSCLADFFLGLLKCAASILKHVGFIIFKVISDPKGSYRYVQQRLRDPIGTYERVKKAFEDAWRIKKLKIMKSLGGSDKMTILSDTLQDTAIYQAFAYKGKTKKEKRKIELENKQRKMRIMQRDKAALKNCKHMLLHTLRKTPCLWFYHVCPVFYPQCLGLLSFMHKFTDILLFLLSFMVWTPCIVCFEGCRAICCCILCTH